MDGVLPVYGTAIAIGLLHGVEPGHGWPVAAVLALNKRNRWAYGIGAALILAGAHLVSSFAVVAVYALASRAFDFASSGWVPIVAGSLLIAMGLRQWFSGHGHTHGHSHGHAHGDEDHGDGHERAEGKGQSLLGLVGFAFALGFVHEEEFAIIALAVGKINPWGLMAVYAGAVALSLVLLTAAAIATFNRFETRMHGVEHALPKVSAVVLVGMGVAYILRWV